MNSLPFWQLKSFLKILIGVQYNRFSFVSEGDKLLDISIILAFNTGNVNELPRHKSRAARKALWHFFKG